MNALLATAAAAATPGSADVNALILGLQSKSDPQRANAIARAPEVGPAAVTALCQLLANSETEVVRAGKRALLGIVRHAGLPGTLGAEAARTEAELLLALNQLQAAQARREVVWLLSEVGKDKTVAALARLLADPELRDDARCALERIPGNAAAKALKAGLKKAPTDFKPAIADSLRKRGEKVSGYPSQRLVPTKTTSVKPGGA